MQDQIDKVRHGECRLAKLLSLVLLHQIGSRIQRPSFPIALGQGQNDRKKSEILAKGGPCSDLK